MTGAQRESRTFQDRALLLRVFSVGFLYPDAAWKARFENLLEKVGRELSCRKGTECGRGIRSLQALVKKIPSGELEREYHRLFGSGGAVSIDAAIYLSENPFEQAKIVADLGGFYKAFGVDVVAGNRSDSFPAMLELGSYLWLKAFHARNKQWKEKEEVTLGAIHSLAKEFFGPSLEGFLKRLEEHQASEFYPRLAHLSREVVHGKI